MSFVAIIIITLSLGIIVGGILILKKSAKHFKLTDEQRKAIQERAIEIEKNDKKDE